jgi:hypothetical protein
MTQQEIIDMWKNSGDLEIIGMPYSMIETFAKLVAEKEREACAVDADWCIQNHLEQHIPKRIRQRGNK